MVSDVLYVVGGVSHTPFCTFMPGPHNWPLPLREVDHPPGLQHYRLFALFLLQGKVRREGRRGVGEVGGGWGGGDGGITVLCGCRYVPGLPSSRLH